MESDESGTLERLQALWRESVDPAIARHAGRIVKAMGDGAQVEFASAVDAVAGAIAIQESVGTQDAHETEDRRIHFRIGIGEDIVTDVLKLSDRP